MKPSPQIVLFASAPLLLALAGCNDPTTLKGKGDTYFDAGQYQVAITDYENYIDIRPGDEEARFNLAEAYTRTGEHIKAAEHLRILHTQAPREARYTEALAESLLAANRRDELYRLLKSEALEQQTMDDWLRLGRFAQRMGDKDTALVALLAAAKVDGGRSWQPHVALYDYHRSMGQRPEAVRRLRMASWVAPNQSEVTRRIEQAGVVTGPTFALRPEEWDARVLDNPLEPFNPFKQQPTSGAVGQDPGQPAAR